MVEPGRLGTLLLVAEPRRAGLRDAGHDTASAVVAVPAQGEDWCYISSGTWSLMGVEVDEPMINDKSLEQNFTNELGAGGKVRLLKNIAGLWLLQECRRAWASREPNTATINWCRWLPGRRPFSAILDPGRVPGTGRHAGKDRRALPRPWRARAGDARRICPQHSGEPGLRYRQVLESLEALLGRRWK